MSGICRESWLAALAEVAPAPEYHPDAITAAEFGELVGLRSSAARERLSALVKAGRARRVSKQIRDVAGRPSIVPAYVLIEPKRKK